MTQKLSIYRLKTFCDRLIVIARFAISIAHAYVFKEPPIVWFVAAIIVPMVFICIAHLGCLLFKVRWQIAGIICCVYLAMGMYSFTVRFLEKHEKL